MTEKRTLPGPATAPFKQGSLMDYVDRHAWRDQTTDTGHYALPDEWRPNEPAQLALTLFGVSRGRSSATFLWRDPGGNTYPMFLTDTAHLIMSDAGVRGGKAEAMWIVVKRGQNFGIAWHGPVPK